MDETDEGAVVMAMGVIVTGSSVVGINVDGTNVVGDKVDGANVVGSSVVGENVVTTAVGAIVIATGASVGAVVGSRGARVGARDSPTPVTRICMTRPGDDKISMVMPVGRMTPP